MRGENHPFKVYSPTKTSLCFDSKDVFLDGFNTYLARRKSRPNLLKLPEAAKVYMVEHKLQPIRQALTDSTET